MPCRHLPRLRFANLPTPLEEAPRLAEALGGPRLFVKREDLSGLAFGGNKSRLLEYVMADLLERGIDTVVAMAAAQSNKLREVAAAAARFGLRAVLLVDDERPASLQGNLLLLDLLGAEVRFLGKPPPGRDMLAAQELVAAQEEVKAELEREGCRVELLERRLGYGALATAAYVDAACEMVPQFAEFGIEPDRMFITAGGGATIAGLVLGLKHMRCPVHVVGVSILQAPATVTAGALDLASRCAERLRIETTVTPDDFTVLDYADRGYGVLTRPVVDAIRLVATHHGMVLDPVYNGKAMSALIDQVRSGAIGPDMTVVLVNTGGGPALFAYGEDLLAEPD